MMGNNIPSFLSEDVDEAFVYSFCKFGIFIVKRAVGTDRTLIIKVAHLADDSRDTAGT